MKQNDKSGLQVWERDGKKVTLVEACCMALGGGSDYIEYKHVEVVIRDKYESRTR